MNIVVVIKLNKPIIYFYYGNPIVNKIILPLSGNNAIKFLDVLNERFIIIDANIYWKIYWWTIKKISVFCDGKKIKSVKPKSPFGNELPCDY